MLKLYHRLDDWLCNINHDLVWIAVIVLLVIALAFGVLIA